MLMLNLKRAIEKRGGTAVIAPDHIGRVCLNGELSNNDVHMYPRNGKPENDYYTVRPITRRGAHDPFSDYNPGGWTFCNRLRDLDWAV